MIDYNGIMRNFIELFTKNLLYIVRYKRVLLDPNEFGGTVKVNLGAGLAVASGWINVDGSLNALLSKSPKPVLKLVYSLSGSRRYYTYEQYKRILNENKFVFYNLGYGLPFVASSVDCFYSSHFLEHLYKPQALKLLEKCYDSLKPGGLMRLSVPDLEYALALYPENKKQMLESYFFVEDNSSDLARHKYMYDYDMLKNILERTGFINIRRCKFLQGECPDIQKLDNRGNESLFVECRKP